MCVCVCVCARTHACANISHDVIIYSARFILYFSDKIFFLIYINKFKTILQSLTIGHACQYISHQSEISKRPLNLEAENPSKLRERERNVLFNDALNTFYLRLYGVRHMVKDHSDSEKGNPLSN